MHPWHNVYYLGRMESIKNGKLFEAINVLNLISALLTLLSKGFILIILGNFGVDEICFMFVLCFVDVKCNYFTFVSIQVDLAHFTKR